MDKKLVMKQIIKIKIEIWLLEKNEDVKNYQNLSNNLYCIGYISLIKQYLNANYDIRYVLESNIKELERESIYVNEYLSLYKKDIIKKYLALKEDLLYLELQQEKLKGAKQNVKTKSI